MSESGSGILVVCGDAGGAAAVAPVLRILKDERKMRVFPMAYAQAPQAWAGIGIGFETLPEKAGRDFAVDVVNRLRPGAVLTGTSVNDQEWEKVFIAAAREGRIPSMAILDFWSNYRARFSDRRDQLVYLPDRIAVMDDRAREEMTAAGFPAERLIVTGQPAFDGVAECRSKFDGAIRRQVRTDLSVGDGERLVVFLSQPLAAFHGGEARARDILGFTERDVFRLVARSLGSISGRKGVPLALVFRPHPRERAEDMPVLRDPGVRLIGGYAGDVRDLLMSSDLVIGMNTALLLESCYLGCFTVSVQPGLKGPDSLPSNRTGASLAVYREADAEPVLEQALFDDAARSDWKGRLAAFLPPRDAARRVAEEILLLAGIRSAAARGMPN